MTCGGEILKKPGTNKIEIISLQNFKCYILSA